MHLLSRVGIFALPVLVSAFCRAGLAQADPAELKLYQNDHAKVVDISVDLTLTAAAILLGVLLYIPAGGSLAKPGRGVAVVTHSDLVWSGFVIAAAIVLLFFLGVVPTIFGFGDTWDVFRIWLPDAVGLLTLLFVVVRLT